MAAAARYLNAALFEIQAEHLSEIRQARQIHPASRDVVYAVFGHADAVRFDRGPAPHGLMNATDATLVSGAHSVEPVPVVDPATDLTRCFLRLANLPNYALNHLSRYEATHWRQVAQILFAFDHLDRCNPLERRRCRNVNRQQELPAYGCDDC